MSDSLVRAQRPGSATSVADEEPAATDPPTPAYPVAVQTRPTRLRREHDGPDPLGGQPADTSVVQTLGRRRGRGDPLPAAVAGPMGEALGADLSAVRVHTDPEAATISRSLQAKAFTFGSDVYFGPGAYDPSSAPGRTVLAHELSHVAADERSSGPVTIGRADDPAERAADASAGRVLDHLRRAPAAAAAPAPEARTAPIDRLRRSPTVRRLQDMNVPPGTVLIRPGTEYLYTVVGQSTDPSGAPVLQVKTKLGRVVNLKATELPSYDVRPGQAPPAPVLAPPDPGGPPPPPAQGPGIPAAPDLDPDIPAAPDLDPDIPAAPDLGPDIPAAPDLDPDIPAAPDLDSGVPAPPEPDPGIPSPPGTVTAPPGSKPTGVTAPVGPVTAPTTLGGMSLAQLAALTVDVPQSSLDQGSKMLLELRASRPAQVNDSARDKLSNCAIVTLAAITGGRTSGQAAEEIRTALKIPESGQPPAKVPQSEKIWTMALLDAKTLADGGVIVPDASRKATATIDTNAVGGSYVIGSAQYHMLIQQLLAVAKTETAADSLPGGMRRSVHQHGLPGADMDDEATLLAAMNKYPNGTRFAVFVHSDTENQAVSAHWVYAERFNGAVLFQDFQVNHGGGGADAYLSKFPFSPNKAKDKGKGFQHGCFMALAVSADPSAVLPDPEVSETAIDTEVAMARDYGVAWAKKMEGPKQLASTWKLPGATTLDAIPAPITVKTGYEDLAKDLGVTATSEYDLTKPGTISIVGHPNLQTRGKDSQIEFDNMNATTKVKKPGEDAVIDSGQLAAPVKSQTWSEAASDSQEAAFSKSFNVMAQNSTKGIEINAERGSFTDLIHEAAHGYEAGRLPGHIREGLADIFGGMVSTKILQTSHDEAFLYAFNPSYAPFVVKAQALIAALGLPVVAKLYFQDKDATAALVAAATHQHAADPAKVAQDLLSDNFPKDFDAGLAGLAASGPVPSSDPTASGGSGPAPVKSATEALLDATVLSFQGLLEAKRAGLETRGLAKGATVMELAQKFDVDYGREVMEQRLALLYTHLKQTSGQPFSETLTLVYGHEVGIAKETGEEQEAVRKRISGSDILQSS